MYLVLEQLSQTTLLLLVYMKGQHFGTHLK